mgnify:CR=1 FL=1
MGAREESSDHYIGTSKGVIIAKSLRRRPADQRWDADQIRNARGTPWDLTPDASRTQVQPDVREWQAPQHQAREQEATPLHITRRRLPIRVRDLEKYGLMHAQDAMQLPVVCLPTRHRATQSSAGIAYTGAW